MINDVTGLAGDPRLAELVARVGAGLILMASPASRHRPSPDPDAPGAASSGAVPSAGAESTPIASGASAEEPADVTVRILAESLRRALAGGVHQSAVVVDPGIGFFRARAIPWHEWDCRTLATLFALRALGRPICVGVSRKSFIGALTGQDDPADRLPGRSPPPRRPCSAAPTSSGHTMSQRRSRRYGWRRPSGAPGETPHGASLPSQTYAEKRRVGRGPSPPDTLCRGSSLGLNGATRWMVVGFGNPQKLRSGGEGPAPPVAVSHAPQLGSRAIARGVAVAWAAAPAGTSRDARSVPLPARERGRVR